MIRAAPLVAAGIAASLGALAMALHATTLRDALVSYLFAYVLGLGAALGSLALLMIHVLTGGEWGIALRAPLIAATRMLPWFALLFVPILIGAGVLYPWAAHGSVADPNLARQRWYLDRSFFALRATFCFAIWITLAARVRTRIAAGARPRGLAAAGLVLYALTLLVASTDWILSLTPVYRSSAFGLVAATAETATAAAFAILLAPASRTRAPLRRDLGNLLLTIILAGAYLAFMQYLCAWIADLPYETAWYLPRTTTSWRWLALTCLALGFGVPFAILVVRRWKESARGLRLAATLVLAAQACYAFWLIVPSVRGAGFSLAWTDMLAPIVVGGVAAAAFRTSPTPEATP